MKMISEDDTETDIISYLEPGQVEGSLNHLAEMLYRKPPLFRYPDRL